MLIHFYKYHGTGNDFIILDNRLKKFELNREQIRNACHRHFGIGADGFMLLELDKNQDFRMVYYNSDGNESTMCGNGGRCITAFAKKLGLINSEANFIAIDGNHQAYIDEDDTVQLKMNEVNGIQVHETYTELNTGSPHYIHFTEYVNEMDIKKEGALIRNSPKFKDEGINVNFVERLSSQKIFVRTYERGVEDETMSCGTGVTAAAIASTDNELGNFSIDIETLGGMLKVEFEKINQQKVKNIWLVGKATFVFEGYINL
jgi:diaminopimelate epimerase